MVKAKVWTLKKKYEEKARLEDFELIEEDLPDTLKDGEFLTEALHWSVDPFMRSAGVDLREGKCMPCEQIARVVASKNSSYPIGSIVRSFTGWRTHTLLSESAVIVKYPAMDAGTVDFIMKMPEVGNLSLSLALGILGMTGMSAYFGFPLMCPKEGETVLVSGAAGAIGNIVGQMAKLKGCKVVGSAGTDDKCKWLKDELGFDEVFNYKRVDLDEALKKAAPEGYDCYFDNVGSVFTSKALKYMKRFGRVCICGIISEYNRTEPQKGVYPFGDILMKRLKVEGFVVYDFLPKWPEGEKQMLEWIQEGKIKVKETVTKGFENMPTAFIGLFEGTNTGKAIVTA